MGLSLSRRTFFFSGQKHGRILKIMLQPHPESPFSSKSIDRVHAQHRLRVAGHLATTALLGIAPFVSVYTQDVLANQEAQATAEIDIQRLYEPLDPRNSNVAIVAIDGFGAYDARTVAKYLGPAAQEFIDGQIWSVEYGNAVLSEEAITEKIVELADVYGVDTVALLGYSAGGIIGARVADELMERSELDIPLLMQVSTPDGADGLRALQLQEIEVAKTIEYIPGAAYSSFVRYIGEMYFRRDRYDEGNPIERLQGTMDVHSAVVRDLKEETMPGTWLLIDQVNIVTSAHLENRFEAMASHEDRKPPVVVYLGTDKPGYDYVVNDKHSGSAICGYAHEHSMECIRFNVPGAVHTRPDLANDAYLEVADKIGPLVRHAIANRHQEIEPASSTIVTQSGPHSAV